MAFSDQVAMTIGERAVAGRERLPVVNPATGAVFTSVPDCTMAELDEAVKAAREAQASWAQTPIEKRRQALLAVAGALSENAQALAHELTLEQGKPFQDALMEVYGAAFWMAETTKLDLPEHVTEDSEERLAVTKRRPVGVVAALVPWNYPILLAAFKLAPALLAGNTVVLKPAPTTPLTTLRVGEILRGVLPPGALNVVSGGDRLGPWMTAHAGFDKISFTGSTQTGRRVMESAAAALKRVTLELGGNDAAIVLPDIDVAAMAEPLFWAAFKNSGQICIAAKRFYIHKDVYEPVKNALMNYAKSVRIGDGLEQGSQIGPVQNKAQYERIRSLVEDAEASGAKVSRFGETPQGDGYFLPITFVEDAKEKSRVVREEQFGPVLPLIRVESADEAIARANDSEYGLGASIWTSHIESAQTLAERLNAGTVWINESQHLSPHAAFGGWKQSGLGVEGGIEGLAEFTQAQTVFVRRKQAAPAQG